MADSKENINTSLRALQALSSGQPSSTLPPILPGLPESFAQLLSQLRYNITSLSLAFKPPITAPAALAQLTKINDNFGRIAACVVAISGGQTGSALAEEWKDGTETIGAEVLRLLDVFIDVAQKEKEGVKANGASGSKDENPYLLHTGLVWDAIDRLSGESSVSEVGAVGKRWKAQGEVMKDAWNEFKEFLEDQLEDADDTEDGDDDDDDDGNDFEMDDEFGELEEMMKGGKMTPGERARAEAVCSPLSIGSLRKLMYVNRQNRFSVYIKSYNRRYHDIYLYWCSIPKNNILQYSNLIGISRRHSIPL